MPGRRGDSIMGLYDTFIDGKKEIQLKTFDCYMHEYKKGSKVPMKDFGFPPTASFFCSFCPKDGFIIIKKNIFIGIRKTPIKDKPIFDCHGKKYEVIK